MKEIVSYKKCFVCGLQNAGGLKARFLFDGTQAFTEMTASEQFEGYQGIYHGGILATLLDEVMIKAILARGIFAVTAELTVRFKRPVTTGDRIRFSGKVTSVKGRLYATEGEAVGDDERPYATATGLYMEAKPELRDRLKTSVE